MVTAATAFFAAGLLQTGAAPDLADTVVDTVVDTVGDASLVVFDEPQPGRQTSVTMATKVNAQAQALRALLTDPAAYRRAIPAFVKADVLPAPKSPQSPDARFVAWELEIPLWNLKGKLWLKPTAAGVDLELIEGDFAPGLFHITVRQRAHDTLLTVAARANVRDVNWLTRRLVARHASMEPAMTAAATWVLMRAFTLDSEHGHRSTAALTPPTLADLDTRPLGTATRGVFGDRLVVGLVRSKPDGRLAHVELAVTARRSPAGVARQLTDSTTWRALPGWQRAKMKSALPLTWDVDSNLAFVDFDALWTVSPGPPFRARSTGDWSGAVMGWDLSPASDASACLAIFSMHPRLDKTGYLPRKFIEAEPLLEHGLALGLGYVNAVALVRALEKAPAPPH